MNTDINGVPFVILELFSGLLVYILPLQKRKNIYISVMLNMLIVILVVVSIKVYIYKIGFYKLGEWNDYLGFIGVFFLMILAVLIYCEVHLKEAIYCATCAYMTEHIVYCLRILINNVVGKSILGSGQILYFLIHIVIYVFAYKFFTKQMVIDKHYTSSALNSIFIMLSTLFMVIVMSIFATVYNFEIIHSIYALFSCFFILFSQLKQQNHISIQKELNIQKQLWIKHKTQYEISRENIDIINRKCHDLKYQVAAIRKISNTEEQKEAIGLIEKSVMIYDSIIETGNDILDTLLTEKGLICSRNNISMTCIADGKLLGFMNGIDVYTLFGNMLDNAIEAVSRIENEEERFISLYVQKKVNLILIQIENKYSGKIEMKNRMPITQKQDKEYHGFGIRSIFHTVEKYNGFATIDTNNSIFMLRITIPNENT